jgi:hypothetical protein
MPSCLEGTRLEMLMTLKKDSLRLKKGMASGEYFIIVTDVLFKEEINCWETKDESEPEGLSNNDYTSSTTTILGHKRVK